MDILITGFISGIDFGEVQTPIIKPIRLALLLIIYQSHVV